MNTMFEALGKNRALAIMILDMFEEVLDKKGIKIPDDERTGSDDEACIYGDTYFALESEITNLLDEYTK